MFRGILIITLFLIVKYDIQGQSPLIDSLTNVLIIDGPKAESLYNIGTAYAQKKDYGSARLYLERAILLSPYNKDIQHNLNYVINNLDTDIIAIKPFFLKKWWQYIYKLTSPSWWAIISLMGISLCIYALYTFWFSQSSAKGIPMALVGGIVILLSLFAAWNRYQEIYQSPFAVVMRETSLLESPSMGAEIIYGLAPGVKIEISNDFGEWLEIKTMDYQSGWIEASTIQRITE